MVAVTCPTAEEADITQSQRQWEGRHQQCHNGVNPALNATYSVTTSIGQYFYHAGGDE